MDPHMEIGVKLKNRQKQEFPAPGFFSYVSQYIPFLCQVTLENFLCFRFYPTQLTNVLYFILSKQWLIQELVLKETPFLSTPLSQCCFFSRTYDSHGYSQGCSSLTRQNFSATHLILEVTQEPVWVGSITLSHHPTSWYCHLLAVGP